MEINLKNVEQLIFQDKRAQSALPWHKHLFDQYNLSLMVPGTKSLGQRSIFELLNSLDGKAVEALSDHFGEPVVVSKLNHKIAESYECQVEQPDRLCEYSGYKEFCLTRNKNSLKASFWR